jgi:hypothetical protein
LLATVTKPNPSDGLRRLFVRSVGVALVLCFPLTGLLVVAGAGSWLAFGLSWSLGLVAGLILVAWSLAERPDDDAIAAPARPAGRCERRRRAAASGASARPRRRTHSA